MSRLLRVATRNCLVSEPSLIRSNVHKLLKFTAAAKRSGKERRRVENLRKVVRSPLNILIGARRARQRHASQVHKPSVTFKQGCQSLHSRATPKFGKLKLELIASRGLQTHRQQKFQGQGAPGGPAFVKKCSAHLNTTVAKETLFQCIVVCHSAPEFCSERFRGIAHRVLFVLQAAHSAAHSTQQHRYHTAPC